jgi:hypothetical protein
MALSAQSLENLIDLVEIKVGAMEAYSESDAHEFGILGATRLELMSQLADRIDAQKRFNVVGLDGQYIQAVPAAA